VYKVIKRRNLQCDKCGKHAILNINGKNYCGLCLPKDEFLNFMWATLKDGQCLILDDKPYCPRHAAEYLNEKGMPDYVSYTEYNFCWLCACYEIISLAGSLEEIISMMEKLDIDYEDWQEYLEEKKPTKG